MLKSILWMVYTQPGQIDEGCKLLSDELDKINNKYQKPLILSEFGTDTLPGCHSEQPEMWSEEYQVEFIKNYTSTTSFSEDGEFVCQVIVTEEAKLFSDVIRIF